MGRADVARGLGDVRVVVGPDDGGGDKAGAYAKLKAAAAHQSWYSRRCADAMGCDRHLLGLKLLLEPGEEVPALFADPLYDRSKHWNLSTSTLASEYFATWGFGEVVADGGDFVGEAGHGQFLARAPYDYIKPRGVFPSPFDPFAGQS